MLSCWRKYNVLCLLSCVLCQAWGNSYWVSFTDKNGSGCTISQPEYYLSPKSLERRQNQNMAVTEEDLPVSEVYLDSLRAKGAVVEFTSRWLNGATVHATASVMENIAALPFVAETMLTKADRNIERPKRESRNANPETRIPKLTDNQLDMLNLPPLHELGYRGQGITIAVVDNGFKNVHLRDGALQNLQIVGVKDFVSLDDSDIFEVGDPAHGSMVLSIMAGNSDTYTGTAPEAAYLLIRTEDDDYENYREIDALVAAFEYADSVGADIVTVSLGYGYEMDLDEHNIPYEQLDGQTIRCTQAANMAVERGMVVCIAQGNDGNNAYHYLTAPADALDILSVGAVDKDGMPAAFSSYGPSADGRVKPDICAQGVATAFYATPHYGTGNGTSFACPSVAGAVACLWQALPHLTASELMELVRSTGSAYNAQPVNYQLGNGILNAYQAYLSARQPDTHIETSQFLTPNSKFQTLYTLQGLPLNASNTTLPHGIYILRDEQGKYTKILK